MISIGLIGCGAVVHANYAATLPGRADYKVDFVCDLDEGQAISAAAIFNARVVSANAVAADADAVIITTPPSTHASLIRQSLREGRTILCEKPFTTSIDEARKLVDEARDAKTNLYVGHFRRTFPQMELARGLVDLGVLGDIESIVASEGGRFTWNAVSNYTTRDPAGGVLWDTGSHTLDMALFGSGLDLWSDFTVEDVAVSRDRPEPSHEFSGSIRIARERPVDIRLRTSRKQALPNLVLISGSRAALTFVVGMDNRVRLTTESGSRVLTIERTHDDLMECLDLQLRRVLLGDGADEFEAARFLGQIKLLEALANG